MPISIPARRSTRTTSVVAGEAYPGEANASTRTTSVVAGEAYPGERPAVVRIEEVPIARPHVRPRRRAAAASQDILVRHELAVVFAERAFQRPVPGVGRVPRRRPFPDVAVPLRV